MYAHTKIEDWRDGSVYNPGDKVPDDLPGIDELEESGAVSKEEYEAPVRETPKEVEIDGVRYIKVDDGGSAEDKTV